MSIVYSYVTSDGTTTQTLKVQNGNSNPINIDSVAIANGAPPDANLIVKSIENVSISTNLDGSFKVFWTVNTANYSPIGPGFNRTFLSDQYQVYEEDFKADGQATTGALPVASYQSGIPGPLSADAISANGTTAFAYVTATGETGTETLLFLAYDSNLQPLALAADIDSVGMGDKRPIATKIGNVSDICKCRRIVQGVLDGCDFDVSADGPKPSEYCSFINRMSSL